MIEKERLYKLAFTEKQNEKEENAKNREIMLKAAYNANPRLEEIENALKGVGAKLVMTTLAGNQKEIKELKKFADALTGEKEAILKKCQVPEIKVSCPICNDTGYVCGKICECIKSAANRIAIKELSAEMPIADSTFANFDLNYYSSDNNAKKRMTNILKLCKEYAINFDPATSKNLMFMGAPGLGKTHLTLAIVGEVLAKGYLPIYGPSENILNEIQKEHFGNENGTFETIVNCDLLVLDDLGTEVITSVSKSILYNVINSRLLNKKPTIINTNLSIKEIEQIYSPRIVSRLIGNYDANLFLGNDIRQQKALKG